MTELIANHVWQSTVFAAGIALLTLAFRRNRAHVRYWLWLAASVKFLIPFAALLWIGTQIELVPIERSGQAIVSILDNAAQPFTQPEPERVNLRGRPVPPPPPNPMLTLAIRGFTVVWPVGSVALLLVWAVRWHRVTRAARASSAITGGPLLDTLRHLEGDAPRGRGAPRVRLVSSNQAIEPGVFGILRPVLMWPAGIEDRLSDEQIAAILAHEVAHVRRRDNLAALIHMLVEAVFWFHPLVWWIGARLVDERERACDEDVVRLGTEPDVYAESILKTCQFYIESPLVCVAGVTGSDLKKRVEQIMRNDAHVALSALKRVSLGAALVAAIAIPVAIGIVTSPRLAAQIVAPSADSPTFEVASLKPSEPSTQSMGRGVPGRFTSQNMTVRRMIRQAYDIHDTQIIGGPDWTTSQGYTIDATTGGKPPDQTRFMMQTLLRDRFKLTFHTEKRDLAIYALVVQRSDGRLGPGLKRIPDDECPPPGSRRRAPPPRWPGRSSAVAVRSERRRPVRLDHLRTRPAAGARRADRHAGAIARQSPGHHVVQSPGDESDEARGPVRLRLPVYQRIRPWRSATGRGSGGPRPTAISPGDEPALFTALQEQLGLKLNPQRATLDVLVIDSIDRPTEN